MKEYSRYTLVDQDNEYDRASCDSIELEILGDFLYEEVRSRPNKFIEWANDQNFHGFSGNLVFCRKDNDLIHIYFDEELMGGGGGLIVSKKTFIGIMQDWERLLKERPKEFTITRDGDIITFESQK